MNIIKGNIRYYNTYIILTILCSSILIDAQLAQSVPFPSKGNSESCNVVQVNCGHVPPAKGEDSSQTSSRNPGPPGKMGPVGPQGEKGSKGELGQAGLKGEKGEDANEIKILKMMSAASCQELNEVYGISTNGRYPMRDMDSGQIASQYCDFNIYEGVSSCKKFISRYGISIYGYYRLRQNNTEEAVYHYCSDVFTCHQLKERDGITSSGSYLLGPMNDQYEADCDFSGADAITSIKHDSTNEIKMTDCENAGCYSKVPLYSISLNNILKITQQSQECRQYIKVKCKGMILENHAWWISRDDQKMTYWGGATSRRSKYCGCGETGQCINKNYNCNCDQNTDAITTADEGFITDKTKLPIKELRFGDMGGSGESGWLTLGKLECMG